MKTRIEEIKELFTKGSNDYKWNSEVRTLIDTLWAEYEADEDKVLKKLGEVLNFEPTELKSIIRDYKLSEILN